MKKGTSIYERYIKGYFQLRLYVFIATLLYIISNYNFTFNIKRTDEYVFDLIYYAIIVLCIFSGIYLYLLSKAIIDNKYKKTVYYINTSLMILSLTVFIYGVFISSSSNLSSTVLFLMPFLAFNIISWITTRRIQDIHFVSNENFLKKSSIGWLILLFVYFTIWAIQPYNRVFHERNWFELNLNESSEWYQKLSEFNKKYSNNNILFVFTDCSYNHFSNNSCLENEIFWEELKKIRDKYNNLKSEDNNKRKLTQEEEVNKQEEMKEVYFKSLENWNYDDLVKIESEIQEIIDSRLYYKWFNDYNKNHNINKIRPLYRLLIDYNIKIKNYSQANIFINKYYDFLIEFSKSDDFGVILFYRINNYYSRLEKNDYTNIIYPENIKSDLDNFKYNYLNIYTHGLLSQIFYSLPDIFLIFNKEELVKYYEYINKDIKNNNYTFSYKPPFFYNSFNTFIYNSWNNSEHYNKRYQEWIKFFEDLIEQSEK